jgi:hypothetical protein
MLPTKVQGEGTTMTPLQVSPRGGAQACEGRELDGALALSLVVWPLNGSRLADEQVPRTRQFYPPEVKAEIRRRYAEGA